jgi:iron complex outermembrane receptor protein
MRLGVRGFNIPGDYNSRILLLVDGRRMNENLYDSMDIDDVFVLDLDLIERVEVVRGPGSSLYGSNAFFAVVNVITRNGRGLNGGEIAGSAGSDDTYQGRLSHGKRLANGVEYLVSGTYHESDGNDRVYAREFDDPATNNGYYEDNDGRQFEQLFGEISFGDFSLQGAFIDREKRVPTGAYETVYNDPNSFTRDQRVYADLSYRTQMESGGEIMARISYDWYEYSGDYPYDYADPGDPPDYVIYKDGAEAQWWGAEAQWSKPLFERHRVTVGGEYRDSLKQAQQSYDVYDTYLDIDTDNNAWGLYAQDEFRVRDDLILSAGIRYDYFDSFGSTTNPRIALVWSPAQRTTLKGIYGTAFRAPSAYELFYDDGGFFQKAAVDLEPEEIETYELILEQQLTQELRGIASVYQNTVENLIAAEEDPADGLVVFANQGSIEVQGAELELLGNWRGGWRGGLSYAYQDAEDRSDGSRLVNFPSHQVKVNLIAPLIGEKLSAGLEWQYESSRKTLAGERTDAFSLTNLTLFSQHWVPGLALSASVYNLFDEQYNHPGAPEHTQDLLEQDGRSFRFKLQYAF